MPFRFLQSLSRTRHFLATRYAGHPLRVFTATLKTVFALHLFQEFGYSLSSTWGASMMPTFEAINDWVLISRFYRRGRNIVVGDIVTFDSVVEPGERVIKRVLGVEGDYVLRDTPGESDAMVQVSWGLP
jgi:mitochondrial inner membrane protease subunit 1